MTPEMPIITVSYIQMWTENFGRNNIIKYFEHLSLNKVLFLYCFQFAFPENDIFFGYINVKYVIRYKKKEEEEKEKEKM